MKPKIYKVFKCGCRSLTHARLKIANNKFQNCCEIHGLDGPVVHKEYTCAECGRLVELPADTKGGTFLYCRDCAEAKRIRDRHDRREVIRAQERRITGTVGGHDIRDEIKFMDNLRNPKSLEKYYNSTMANRVNWGDIDPNEFKQECEKRGVRV